MYMLTFPFIIYQVSTKCLGLGEDIDMNGIGPALKKPAVILEASRYP